MANMQKYIKDVRLSGYKSIKNVTCEFDQGLNIIIGNNGSGKSNLLEFVYKIVKRDYSGLDIFDAKINFVDVNESMPNSDFEALREKNFTWHAERRIAKKEEGFEANGLELVEPETHDLISIFFVRFNAPKVIGILSHELNAKYNFKNKRFLLDSYEEDIPEVLSVWLRNVFNKNYLENIKAANELTDEYLHSSLEKSFDDEFSIIKKKLAFYTPIEDLRFSNAVRITNIDSSTYEFRNIVFEYKINNQWFAWDSLSDGTRRLIYMVFTINGIESFSYHTPYKYIPITLLEEPEIGIHPHQLHLILDFLREKSKEQQIIITTHSPQVLDILGPDELNKIIIAEIDYENGTVLRHLNEEEIKKARFYFKDEGLLSDYWRFSDFQRDKEK